MLLITKKIKNIILECQTGKYWGFHIDIYNGKLARQDKKGKWFKWQEVQVMAYGVSWIRTRDAMVGVGRVLEQLSICCAHGETRHQCCLWSMCVIRSKVWLFVNFLSTARDDNAVSNLRPLILSRSRSNYTNQRWTAHHFPPIGSFPTEGTRHLVLLLLIHVTPLPLHIHYFSRCSLLSPGMYLVVRHCNVYFLYVSDRYASLHFPRRF